MKIGVTGASGFIGGHLLKALQSSHDVEGFSESSNDTLLNIAKKTYSSLKDIEEFTRAKDVLIFTSGPVDPRGVNTESLKKLNENILLLKRFTEFFFEQNPRGKFIFFSSAGAVYEVNNPSPKFEESPLVPQGFYGELKIKQEEMLKNLYGDHDLIILRPTNVYGDPLKKNQATGIIDKLIRSLRTSEITEVVANLQSERDYLFIDDLCNLVSLIVEGKAGKLAIYNASAHNALTIAEIIQGIHEIFSPNRTKVCFKDISQEQNSLMVNSTKIREAFGWSSGSNFRENLAQIKKRI